MKSAPLHLIRRGIRSAGFDVVRYYDNSPEEYHKRHRSEALQILKVIESYRGTTPNGLIKQCDAYARDELGADYFAPWLYVYSALVGGFRSGWIPDNYYGAVVVPRCKGQYGTVSSLRAFTNILFRTDVFPDVLYAVNGRFFRPDGVLVKDRDVPDVVFSGRDKIVFKSENSSRGNGVFFFTRQNFDLEQILKRGNGVVQSWIEQHGLFSQFSPNSTATLRITTVIDQAGAPSVRACYLRLGRLDDTHVKSSSHVRVAVDMATGQFSETGYLSDWSATPHHPDTKIAFSSSTVPLFKECTSAVLKLHATIPFAQCIGWDVIVDKNDSVKVMEWNGDHNDIKFSEATQGPCFSDLGWETLWKSRDLQA